MLGPEIRRVAVLRALMLGDLLCSTPALRALRHGLPGARIALVGLPWARELAERLASVDEFIEFPGWPGLPERPPADARQRLGFLVAMNERRFDLALQMHGSGPIVNTLTAAFGARRNAGFSSPRAAGPAADAQRFTPWPDSGSEVERLLRLTDHLGLPRQGLELDFPLREADRREARALLRQARPAAADRGAPLVIVHAGSQLPSRRWPAERFAAVADALADQGAQVALTGSAAEAGFVRTVAAAMRSTPIVLAGRTTPWSLGALVEQACLVVCNDTGISHIAAALGTPSVVVASGSDVRRWAPADTDRHTVLWQDRDCRPCSHVHCPIGNACAAAIGVDEVRLAALRSLRATALSA